MTNTQFKIKRDKFKKSRGGDSRVIEIFCNNCKKHICFYQKDGAGSLKRMYVDRIIDGDFNNSQSLFCTNCNNHLGNLIIYKKENRLAFGLFAGAVFKKIIKN